MDNFNNGHGVDIKDKYFAAHEDPKEVAKIVLQKGRSFFTEMEQNGYLSKLKRMWRFYHGDFGSGTSEHAITFGGEDGELTNLMVNHFRNIAQHILNMVASSRPSLEARAVNSDYKSQAQTYIANGILEYYMREKLLENALREACEMSIVLGSAFIKMEWNATAGEKFEYDEETGQYTYEGELEFEVISPFDCVFDGTKDRWSKEWVLIRSKANRYNLMAKYPEHAEKIAAIPKKDNTFSLSMWSNDSTDDIFIYEFYHESCEALPDGRYILMVSDDTVLLDAALPYRQVPVFRVAPGNIIGTPYGYSPMFDLFPLQQAANATASSIMTNQAQFAVQNVFVKRGSDLNISSIENGMNIIEANEAPQALNLTNTPKEVFEFYNILVSQMETISGVNSVARGNPEASLRSGTALAIVQSMALQFMSGLQQSYVKMLEDVGTGLIQILKDYATTPKVVALVGKNNRTKLKEFTGESISAINRVIVDVSNPLSTTLAGKVNMAEQLLQMKLIKNPQEYLQIIATGRIEPAYQGEVDEMLLIQLENEELIDGIQQPLVAPTDAHSLHINEHKAVLSDPEFRRNPALVKRVMDHIMEHKMALQNVDAELLAIVGEQASPLNPSLQALQGPPPPPPGGENPPMPPNSSMEGAIPGTLEQPQGLMQPGDELMGPQGPAQMPAPSNVDGSLLPNPQLQQQAMGNVK